MPVWLWLLVWILLFAAGAAWYVLTPVLRRQGAAVSEAERRRSELLARRETILTALRELDLDYAVGKLPDDLYQAQRRALLREGAQVLKALDAVEQQLGHAAPTAETATNARLEALLEQRRRERARAAHAEQAAAGGTAPPRAPATTPEAVDDLVESLLLARRRQQRARFTGFCPHCGAPYQANDRFCGKCGRPLHDGAGRRKRRSRTKS